MKDFSFLKENLIAHRGYHNLKKGIPENSISAFKEAIKNNYSIEIDIHILKDNTVIVFHDDDLLRVTGTNKKLKDLTYDDIKNITLFNTNEKIPTFDEVLKLIDGKVPLLIEFKTDQKCGLLEKEAMKYLKNYTGKYAVQSFSPLTINWFRKNEPTILRGQLATIFTNKDVPYYKRKFMSSMVYNLMTKPDFISFDVRKLPNKKITKIKRNKFLLGWVVRDKEAYIKLKDYCDNLICENFDEILKG